VASLWILSPLYTGGIQEDGLSAQIRARSVVLHICLLVWVLVVSRVEGRICNIGHFPTEDGPIFLLSVEDGLQLYNMGGVVLYFSMMCIGVVKGTFVSEGCWGWHDGIDGRAGDSRTLATRVHCLTREVEGIASPLGLP
jgi:hypothetical protein